MSPFNSAVDDVVVERKCIASLAARPHRIAERLRLSGLQPEFDSSPRLSLGEIVLKERYPVRQSLTAVCCGGAARLLFAE